MRCIGSEHYCDKQYFGKVNVAFSSPPYFTLEQYSNDETQAAYNKDYGYFINTWWRKTVNNIDQMLSDDGLFIININDMVNGLYVGQDMINVIREKGYQLADVYKIKLSKNLRFIHSNEHKYEPIYIFKK